jgi:hypothetical protein
MSFNDDKKIKHTYKILLNLITFTCNNMVLFLNLDYYYNLKLSIECTHKGENQSNE